MKPKPKKIKFFRCPNCPNSQTSYPVPVAELVEATPHPAPDLSDWLDSQDVMQILHISPRTLHTLRSNGTIPFSRIGNKFYYRKQDIQKILANNYIMYEISTYGSNK